MSYAVPSDAGLEEELYEWLPQSIILSCLSPPTSPPRISLDDSCKLPGLNTVRHAEHNFKTG